jgi:murein DD-endopeptidase MepM/ murein hydrolase activator NlpD
MPSNAAFRRAVAAYGRSAVFLSVLLLPALLAERAPASRREIGEPPRWHATATPALAARPLAGPFEVGHDFGDPRPGGRHHEGVDIAAPKMTPVYAVADGEVRWVQDGTGAACCALEILHDDGWRSRYIHLNNDSPGTDDGLGFGVAEGLHRGVRVRAGQCIGWVGDSGNAEAVGPHLHFELRNQCGEAVDPRASLLAACQSQEGGD